MSKITYVGADVHKTTTTLVFLNSYGKKIGSRRMHTDKVVTYFSNHPIVTIGMEVGIGTQYLAKKLNQQGHKTKVMPARKIKAFYMGQKNDEQDALAVAHATMACYIEGIQLKPTEALIAQAFLRQREQIIRHRVAACNQIRGLLVEHGFKFSQGINSLIDGVKDLLKKNIISRDLKDMIRLSLKIIEFHINIEKPLNKKLKIIAERNPETKRLQTIPGFGPLGAIAFLISIGNATTFKRGRDVSAFLGLIPKQNSSGNKIRLGRITKSGNEYTRCLMIHGARAFICHGNQKDKNKQWLLSVKNRCGYNKAAVAWANKMARIAWALLIKNATYKRELVSLKDVA